MNNIMANNIILLFMINSGNVFNYLFQLLAGRVMSPMDYGIFNSINSIAVVLSVPLLFLPMVFSRYTVKYYSHGMAFIRQLIMQGMKFMSIVLLVLLLLFIFMFSFVKDYLHLEQDLSIQIILLQVSITLFLPILLGVLQGLNRFYFYGAAFGSIMAFRLLAGVVFLYLLDLGVNGALFAGTVGVIAAFAIAILGVKDVLLVKQKVEWPDGLFQRMSTFALPVFISTSMVILIGNIDIIFVRHYCEAEMAGLYSMAAILGRIAFALPLALLAVLFPAIVQAKENNKDDYKILNYSLAGTILIGGGFALVSYVFPEQIIVFLFGEQYIGAVFLFQIISIANAALAISNVFFTYYLARGQYSFLWVQAVGVTVMVVLVYLFHDNAQIIAWELLFSIGLILFGLLIMHFGYIKKRDKVNVSNNLAI